MMMMMMMMMEIEAIFGTTEVYESSMTFPESALKSRSPEPRAGLPSSMGRLSHSSTNLDAHLPCWARSTWE
jgi:hypothetical protein